MTVIISGMAYVEPIAYKDKNDAIAVLVNERGCISFGNDVYLNSTLTYRLIEVEVR